MNGAKSTHIAKTVSVKLVGSTDSSLQWLIRLIFYNVFFLRLYCKNKYILGHLYVFFFISDGTTGFLDENWSSIAKKIKKSKYDLYSLYF